MTSVSINKILDISKQEWREFGEAGKGHLRSPGLLVHFPERLTLLTGAQIAKSTKRQ